MNIQEFLSEHPEAEYTLKQSLPNEEITEISLISQGSTNRSYLINATENCYVLRIPGAGSEQLIDRYAEKQIYYLIKDYGIGDEIIYLNPENGHKVTRYIKNTRTINISDKNDIKLFIKTVRNLHNLKLKCSAEYDFYENIKKYESLRNKKSKFPDYDEVKENIFSLRAFTEKFKNEYTLIHNDLSNENCLFTKDGEEEKCVLIDFEYAAMQTPMADIAYFCVFENLSDSETDYVIDCYFDFNTPPLKKAECYAYIALNGLTHSNWLEFKASLDEERKEENEKAFNIAKRYYNKTIKLLGVIQCQE